MSPKVSSFPKFPSKNLKLLVQSQTKLSSLQTDTTNQESIPTWFLYILFSYQESNPNRKDYNIPQIKHHQPNKHNSVLTSKP
jgi:hypothetical protein